MAKYKTTITKKDGTTASGYIENDRGYYDDGTALSAGDSIIDAQNKVWTKADASAGAGAGTGSTGNNTPNGADALTNYINGLGVSTPSGLGNYPTGNSSTKASYSIDKAEQPGRTGLRSARELGNLYDIGYDMDDIRKVYDDATNAKYTLLSKELKQAENDFYANQANANATLLDSLRKATSSAIATGASRGLASAEQLGLMMEAQQGIVEGATDMAQQRANMADEIAAEKADNIVKALEYSNQLKQGLATNSTNIYSADTQYDVGLLDFMVNNRNVDALLEQIATEKDVNLRAQDMDALKAILADATDRSEGAANRQAQKEMNDATIAGNKEAAAITAAGYSKSGSGSGVEDYIYQVQEINRLMDEAYAAGDVGNYITYRMARNALTNNTSETQSDIYDIVMKDKYFKNSTAWKANQPKTTTQTNNKTTNTTKNSTASAPNLTSNTTNTSDPEIEAMYFRSVNKLLYGELGIDKGYENLSPEVQAAYDRLYGKPKRIK